MKKLGILGGMGPESTLLYYKEIASRFQARESHGAFPSLTIECVNMYEMLGYCFSGQYEKLTQYLLKGIRNLEASQVDFIILASNTPHIVFDQLQKESNVPLLSILEPTFKAVKSQGLKKVAWLGIRFSMEEPYFRKIFTQNDIEVAIPNAEERAYIDTVISKELEFGIVKEESKANIDHILQRLITEEGIQGVILGCTELPLMYTHSSLPIPTFDTVEYHIQGIIDHMFAKSGER